MPPKKAAAGAKKPRGAKNAHQLAAPIPSGTVLTDFRKKLWTVGKPIGSGGFGLLYLASAGDQKGDAQHVVKVEPHSNGPLFCELNFYQRAAKPEMVTAWMSERKLKTLGMPQFIASGAWDRAGVKYRFMIMEKFGTDLQKLFEANRKVFPHKAVLQLAVRVFDVLEYIHAQGFVHADIKAANLLLGFTKSTQNQVYLVDYGLAFRYIPDGTHKEYKEDPKRCHDGTIEFTSRDAHKGATPSRRGDLEILGYCLLQWLCSKLPWEDKLTDPNYVRDQKIRYMKDVPFLMKTCFPESKPPDELQQYLQYVNKLGYSEKPDYDKCRQIFRTAMKKHGYSDTALQFTAAASPKKPTASAARGRKRVSTTTFSDEDENEVSDSDEATPIPKRRVGRGRGRVPAVGRAKSPAGPPCPPIGIRGPPIEGARAKSPAGRVKSPQGRAPARKVSLYDTTSTVNGNGIPARRGRETRSREVAKEVSSVATQTSPGLKGLERSRRR